MDHRNHGATLDYITATFVQEPDWLAAIRATGETLRPGMQMSAFEGALLAWLVKLTGAKRVLEIGTFMGTTALWMASAGAEVTTLEFNADYAAKARAHVSASPYARQIAVEQGDALAWLATQPHMASYDMVFIDAEKRSYVKYLDAVLPLLTHGALVVGDNTLLWGAVTGENETAASKEATATMRAFNARLADPEYFDGIMLPTAEGLTMARRK